MKTENGATSSAAIGTAKPVDTSKLMSLLALAAGAVAMPEAGYADIIFTDLSANPPVVSTLNSPSFLIDNLPGVARLGIRAGSSSTALGTSRFVLAIQSGGYIRIKTNNSFVVPVAAGLVWNQIGGPSYSTGIVGTAHFGGHSPGSFSNRYIAFKFQDSTQANKMLFGWVDISLSNPADDGNPTVTITGYAYDNSGSQIAMGQVPEPSAMAILAIGALAFGAKGVRSWRRNRVEPTS